MAGLIGEKESTGELPESNRDIFWCNNPKYEIYSGNRLMVVDYDSDFGNIRSFSVPDYIDRDGD